MTMFLEIVLSWFVSVLVSTVYANIDVLRLFYILTLFSFWRLVLFRFVSFKYFAILVALTIRSLLILRCFYTCYFNSNISYFRYLLYYLVFYFQLESGWLFCHCHCFYLLCGDFHTCYMSWLAEIAGVVGNLCFEQTVLRASSA